MLSTDVLDAAFINRFPKQESAGSVELGPNDAFGAQWSELFAEGLDPAQDEGGDIAAEERCGCSMGTGGGW